jgi:cell division protein ZapA (FtsZ GTPase activity inhibitor)
MSAKLLEVTLAGVRVKVPLYRDDMSTLAIAETVNARFKHLEAQGAKVNTQLFALQTAFSLAVDLAQSQESANAADHDLLRALDKIEATLQATLAEIAAPSE